MASARLDCEDELALHVSGLEQPMCFRGLLERKHGADDGPEPTGFDRDAQLVEQAAVSAVEQDPVQRDVPVERKVEVALQVNDCRGASALADRREAAREARAADEIRDGIELSACALLRSRERIAVAVVDRRGRAESKQELVVSSACKRDRLSAGCCDQLDCEDAYAAAGAVNQHAFAGLDSRGDG